MSRQIPVDIITQSALAGIKSAFDLHYDMSGCAWLDDAPEYYVTSSIANALANLEGAKYVTLEAGVKNTMDDAGAVSRGRYNRKIRRNGRCDVLLWWGNGNPRAVIEVKSPLYCLHQKALDDLHRIEHILLENHQDHSIQFGLFCFYSSWADNNRRLASEALNDVFEKMKDRAVEAIPRCSITGTKNIYPVENEGGAWLAGCFCISAR